MSVATLLAGAKYRGQFEERVLDLVKLLKGHDGIVFIDNVHNLVNAGLTRGGTLDAASLLKPFLLRGELQVIGATTHDEYRQNVEKDTSLLRCFQLVTLEEPSVELAAAMCCHVRQRYEAHHRVLLPPVFRSNLPDVQRLSIEQLVSDVRARGGDARYLPNVEEIVATVSREASPGDLLVVMSHALDEDVLRRNPQLAAAAVDG
jgi:hypothetical protein